MLEGACLEHEPRPFKPEDLLNALPVFSKPVIEIRTAGDVTVLESPMPLIPGLGLLPPTPIRGAIRKQIGNILMQRRLIVLGKEEIVSLQSMDLRTQQALGMHGIQGEDAPLDQLGRQQRFERTDFIFFLLYIAVPQDNASGHLITIELMYRMRLRSRPAQGLAIDSQVSMIGLSLWRLQAARFLSTPLLCFSAHKKGG
jgi:hypothetical protein